MIYAKGAARLADLGEVLGRDKFRIFLAALVRKHIKNTAALLDELERQSSLSVREQFERSLKT